MKKMMKKMMIMMMKKKKKKKTKTKRVMRNQGDYSQMQNKLHFADPLPPLFFFFFFFLSFFFFFFFYLTGTDISFSRIARLANTKQNSLI